MGLSRGFAHVEYESAEDAEEAKNNMHGGQLDGNVITCVPEACHPHDMLEVLLLSGSRICARQIANSFHLSRAKHGTATACRIQGLSVAHFGMRDPQLSA